MGGVLAPAYNSLHITKTIHAERTRTELLRTHCLVP